MCSELLARIEIEIDTRNAAFEHCLASEVARILKDACKWVHGMSEGSLSDSPLVDSNGKTVGRIRLIG